MNEAQKQFFRAFVIAHTIVVILSVPTGLLIGYAIKRILGW